MSLPKFRVNYLVDNIVTRIFVFDGYKAGEKILGDGSDDNFGY